MKREQPRRLVLSGHTWVRAVRVQRAVAAAPAPAVVRVLDTIFASVRHNPKKTRGVLAIVVLFSVLLLHSNAGAAGFLDTFRDDLKTTTDQWFTRAFFLAQFVLFPALAVIGLTLTLISYYNKNDTFEGSFAGVIEYFAGILPAYAVMVAMQGVVPTIVDNALGLGSYITGFTVISPSQVLSISDKIDNQLYVAAAQTHDFITVPLMSALGSITIDVVFALLAAELLVTYAEAYVVLSVGALEFAWAANRATASYTGEYYGAVRSTVYRAIIIVALLSIGARYADTWANLFSTVGTSAPFYRVLGTVIGEIVVYLVISWKVTEFASNLFSGRPVASGKPIIERGLRAAKGMLA